MISIYNTSDLLLRNRKSGLLLVFPHKLGWSRACVCAGLGDTQDMRLYLILLLGVLSAGLLAAMPTPSESWQFSIRAENDLTAGTDNYYTNGGDLAFTSPAFEPVGLSANLVAWGPFSSAPQAEHRATFRLAQDIITPIDYTRAEIDPDDRPFAAWLRFGAQLRAIEAHRMDVVEVSLGMTGEPALGEFAQKVVHLFLGSPDPVGWDTQVPTEPTLQLTWVRYGRFREDLDGGFAFDVIPGVGGAVGNAHTYATASTDVRFGFRLPQDFGQSRILPAARYNDTFALDEALAAKRGAWGMHAQIGFDVRAVAHDVTLDGAVFRDSPSVEKEPFVANFTTGLAMHWDRWNLSFRQVFRSPEFDNQATWHIFGSIALDVLL